MRSNYKMLGSYIKKVDIRNRNLQVDDLRGLSMTKEFRKSTSNVIGTDMSRYKIVEPGKFACDFMSVIRVHKLPVVLNSEKSPVIVSPAYTVFEVIDETEMLPDYLMMWFRRSEFDRYADFRCDSAIRGGFAWNELCEVELPIPSLKKQQEIVDEYTTVINRIKLNEKLIHNLDVTAHTLYKQWFVEFEFPISKEYADSIGKPELEGQPYKSSSGEMIYNRKLEKVIPKDWKVINLGKLVESYSKKHSFPNPEIIFFNTSDILDGEFLHSEAISVKKLPGQAKKRIQKNDILYSEIRPENRRFAMVRVDNAEEYVVSTKLMVLRLKSDKFSSERIFHYLTSEQVILELQRAAEGRSGTFPQITYEEHIEPLGFLIATNGVEEWWNDFLKSKYAFWYNLKDENLHLKKLADLVLMKISQSKEFSYEIH